MSRMIVMTDEQFKAVTFAANVLSNTLYVLEDHKEIEVVDLDGDPDPGALDRWKGINKDAHDALLKAQFLDEFLGEPT